MVAHITDKLLSLRKIPDVLGELHKSLTGGLCHWLVAIRMSKTSVSAATPVW